MNTLEIRQYTIKDTTKDIILTTDTDILDGRIVLRITHDRLIVRRATLEDRDAKKLKKNCHKYRTTIYCEHKAGHCEFIEDESDEDTLTFELEY